MTVICHTLSFQRAIYNKRGAMFSPEATGSRDPLTGISTSSHLVIIRRVQSLVLFLVFP